MGRGNKQTGSFFCTVHVCTLYPHRVCFQLHIPVVCCNVYLCMCVLQVLCSDSHATLHTACSKAQKPSPDKCENCVSSVAVFAVVQCWGLWQHVGCASDAVFDVVRPGVGLAGWKFPDSCSYGVWLAVQQQQQCTSYTVAALSTVLQQAFCCWSASP